MVEASLVKNPNMNVTGLYWWSVNIGSGWCRQATIHYLSQCWHRSLSPYGVSEPRWVKHIYVTDRSSDEILKEARYKIIQNDGFSWKKNHMQSYGYGNSKYTKIISGLHAAFLLHVFESCMKFNFGPKISIHIWCDYFMFESLVYSANHQKLILWHRQLFYLHNSHISVNCNW